MITRRRLSWLSLAAACAALGIAIAALVVASSSSTTARPTSPPAATRVQLCALLGAIMDDSDSTVGLFARAARLYRDDGCR